MSSNDRANIEKRYAELQAQLSAVKQRFSQSGLSSTELLKLPGQIGDLQQELAVVKARIDLFELDDIDERIAKYKARYDLVRQEVSRTQAGHDRFLQAWKPLHDRVARIQGDQTRIDELIQLYKDTLADYVICETGNFEMASLVAAISEEQRNRLEIEKKIKQAGGLLQTLID